VRAVPVGLYAKAALERLGAWGAAVEPKMAMGEAPLGAFFTPRGEA